MTGIQGDSKAVIKPARQSNFQRSTDPDLHYYSIERKLVVVRLLMTGLATCQLLIPTLLLFFIKDTVARLIIVATFTMLFSLCLASLTRAKRHEIFSTTAA